MGTDHVKFRWGIESKLLPVSNNYFFLLLFHCHSSIQRRAASHPNEHLLFSH